MADRNLPGGGFSNWMPARKAKLKFWAKRSAVVLVLAYGAVALNGPGWLVWAAWAYVALTLVTAFLLTRPGK
ncbi:MAG: hypothetical protein D6801_07405 [Alphaproteobacteria bacterium]|nr:MAG: hypothetical protein D6801_07405 [Alphaproteobacteria bacterium]